MKQFVWNDYKGVFLLQLQKYTFILIMNIFWLLVTSFWLFSHLNV